MFEDLIDLSDGKISYEKVLLKSIQIKSKNIIMVGGEEYKSITSNLPKNSIMRNGIIYFKINFNSIPNLETALNTENDRIEPIIENGNRYVSMDLVNEYMGLSPYAIRLYKTDNLIYTKNKDSIYFPVNMNSHTLILLNNIIHYSIKNKIFNEEDIEKYLIYLTEKNKSNTFELINEELLITLDGLYYLAVKLNMLSIKKILRSICIKNNLYSIYCDKFIEIDNEVPLVVYSELPIVRKPVYSQKSNIKSFLNKKFIKTKIDNKDSKNIYTNIKFIYMVYMRWEYVTRGGDTEILPYNLFVKEVTSHLKTEIVDLNTSEDIYRYHLKNYELIQSNKSFILESITDFNKLKKEMRERKNYKSSDINILNKHCTLSIVIIDNGIKKSITINNIESFTYKRGVLEIVKKNDTYQYDNVLRIEMI